MKPTKKLESTAYHEVGHAVMAHLLGVKLNSTTIVPDEDSDGHVIHANPLRGIQLDVDGSNRARLRAESAIQVAFAGPIAQKKSNPHGYRHWHAEFDHKLAVDLLFRIGGSEKAVQAYSNLLYEWTKGGIETRWYMVDAVATALLERGPSWRRD